MTPADAFSIGYFKNFGVAAKSADEAKKMLESAVIDGRIDWSESEWGPIERPATEAGIWFESGRLLFTEHPKGETEQ